MKEMSQAITEIKSKVTLEQWQERILECKERGKSNILFEYRSTRNGDHAARFLGDYTNYLVCDGYDGYNQLKSAVRCGCWAHLRRKLVSALPADKELLASSAAAKGVE